MGYSVVDIAEMSNAKKGIIKFNDQTNAEGRTLNAERSVAEGIPLPQFPRWERNPFREF